MSGRNVSGEPWCLEVALAVVLLVGASLLGRTVSQVLDVDPGFRAEGVLTAVTIPPRNPAGV